MKNQPTQECKPFIKLAKMLFTASPEIGLKIRNLLNEIKTSDKSMKTLEEEAVEICSMCHGKCSTCLYEVDKVK